MLHGTDMEISKIYLTDLISSWVWSIIFLTYAPSSKDLEKWTSYSPQQTSYISFTSIIPLCHALRI